MASLAARSFHEAVRLNKDSITSARRHVCISPSATETLRLVTAVFQRRPTAGPSFCVVIFTSKCKPSSPLGEISLDKSPVPGLQADQCVLDTSLVVFGHVLMHVGVVLSDIALGAAVGNSPKSEWRGVGVWTLELQRRDEKKTSL